MPVPRMLLHSQSTGIRVVRVWRMRHMCITAAICNGWGKCKYKILSSLLRLVTVDNNGFNSQPLQIAKRYAQA